MVMVSVMIFTPLVSMVLFYGAVDVPLKLSATLLNHIFVKVPILCNILQLLYVAFLFSLSAIFGIPLRFDLFFDMLIKIKKLIISKNLLEKIKKIMNSKKLVLKKSEMDPD